MRGPGVYPIYLIYGSDNDAMAMVSIQNNLDNDVFLLYSDMDMDALNPSRNLVYLYSFVFGDYDFGTDD